MSRILVTGDAGFIGSHVARHFLTAGHEVVGYDAITDYYDPRLKHDRLNRLESLKGFEHITGQLEDRELLFRTVAEFSPELVIHLAAQAGVRYSITNPETYISSNLVGSANLLEAMRAHPPKHLMMASTSSVYGGNEKIPFSECDRTDSPVSLYAATKRSMESLAHSTSHLWGIPTTIFRFFTVYGPWGRPDMALFKFVRAMRNEEPIDVYGYGKMRRDFTYIDDLVRSIARLSDAIPQTGKSLGAHDSLSPVAPYRVVNIAGGAPTGLLDFITAIEASVGVSAKRNMLPMQPGDVIETYSDTSLLEDLIGVVPSTSIKEGVEVFVQWYIEYFADREREGRANGNITQNV